MIIKTFCVWIRHYYNNMHVFLVLKIGMIHEFLYFLYFEEHFKRNFIQLFLYFIHICHINQIYKLLLLIVSFHFLCFIPFLIKVFFNEQYAVFILPKHLVEVLSRWKKVFWVSHSTPVCGANEAFPPASY